MTLQATNNFVNYLIDQQLTFSPCLAQDAGKCVCDGGGEGLRLVGRVGDLRPILLIEGHVVVHEHCHWFDLMTLDTTLD